ncbi:hypothetical protein [Novosphingobium pokkalii]|uniref:Uncharacterized protein n=1 Tax=Novosphingobium pokkalii TaxID=1770194 RepID=A0ABV7V1L6_9SPHN|nr:hypothetical protein [Novosphingobium pokkalii]GHC97040.1 hypothetical protein GCM10019060_27480 [Novosphingobium pokkalii]
MRSDQEYLLDRQAAQDPEAWPDEEPFGLVRGILFALPLSALLWVGIYFAVKALW